ncbi:hypothetical protein PCO82_17645 [Pectobacteriaceae bacterium CE90]|nr:hypothetical protein PCO82_17645 [Pectobacteriaceae bacterium CE90]
MTQHKAGCRAALCYLFSVAGYLQESGPGVAICISQTLSIDSSENLFLKGAR